MKRTRRGEFSSITSMDLLLDTMCNTFGAIVLIAILVALLSQNSGPKPPDAVTQKETSEMLERKIASALDEIDRLQALLSAQAVGENEALASLAEKKRSLEATLQTLRNQIQESKEDIENEIKKSTVDLGDEFAQLKKDIADLQARMIVLENSKTTQDENSERLSERQKSLLAQIDQEKKDRVTVLRFPKERTRTKTGLNIILRYGKAYPFQTSPGSREYSGMRWKEGSRGMIAEPIKESGIQIGGDSSELTTIISQFGRASYQPTFHVYPDSFEDFAKLKEAVISLGYDYGMSVMDPDETYTWGEGGTAPPPL